MGGKAKKQEQPQAQLPAPPQGTQFVAPKPNALENLPQPKPYLAYDGTSKGIANYGKGFRAGCVNRGQT